jgi:hypothetical protein
VALVGQELYQFVYLKMGKGLGLRKQEQLVLAVWLSFSLDRFVAEQAEA